QARLFPAIDAPADILVSLLLLSHHFLKGADKIMRTRRHLTNHKLLSMNDRGLRHCLALLLGLIVGASPLAVTVYGQTYQGGLRGAAHDTTGAVIVGAQLKLINEETNVERSTTTNSDGEYSFANVLPGTYTLSASQTGFKKAEYKGIRIGTHTFITLALPS